MEGGLIYADTRGMLEDRISSLRKVNIYESQRYRHIVGLPVVLGEKDGEAETETPFLIVRIMREGQMDVFATGCYRDRIKPDASGALRFSQRIVVCDSRRFDTLVAIPF
jgi:3-phenylpropionate/cinnamic acid dioxygenase small subunit